MSSYFLGTILSADIIYAENLVPELLYSAHQKVYRTIKRRLGHIT